MFLNVQQIERSCHPSCHPLSNLPAHVRLDALEKAIPLSAIEQALRDTNTKTKRERKLNLVVTMLLVIAMNLFVNDGIGYVLQRLCKGARLLQFLKENGRSAKRKSGAMDPMDPASEIAVSKSAGILGDIPSRLPGRLPGKLPGDGALVYRRYQLGVRPLHSLFRTLCRPFAQEVTAPQAFLLPNLLEPQARRRAPLARRHTPCLGQPQFVPEA